MKVLFLILISILIPGSELGVYKNDDFRFEVQFPTVHQEENYSYEVKFAAVECFKLSGQETIQGGNLSYSLIASHYLTNENFTRSGMKLQDFVFNHAKHINEESFLNNNFIIISDQQVKNTLYYVVGDATMETFMHKKIVVQNDMTYSLSIMSKKGPLPQENIDSFFRSLKIKAQ